MKEYTFTVWADQPVFETEHFWEAVGNDNMFPQILGESGDFLFERNRTYRTVRMIRNHHVLSELWENGKQIGGNVYSEDEKGNPVYDFRYINQVYAKCLENGIKPVVEMDYMPKALARPRKTPLFPSGEWYERASFPDDWDKWRTLLVKFTENLVETFGLEEVRTWYFEAWNEPDLCALVPMIQQWPAQEWDQFMRLYDVFVDAVTSVDSQLKVGGPGGCTPAFMMQFFQHVCTGTNYVTGTIGTRVDFISYHFYGMIGFDMESFPLESTSVAGVIHELHAIHAMMQQFPQLKDVEFHLNEWGECAQGGLNKTQYLVFDILRNSEYSALYLVKLLGSLFRLKERTDFLPSLLLYWGFTGEDAQKQTFWGTRGLTTWPRICKPLLTVMEMLTMLGTQVLKTSSPAGGRVGAFAMKAPDENGLQVAVWNFDETRIGERYEEAPIALRAEGLAAGDYRLDVYVLGREKNNTYAVYKSMEQEKTLTEKQLKQIAAANDWSREAAYDVEVDGAFTWTDTIGDNEARFYILTRRVDREPQD